MSAATDVELDQQTRDELQPPCEADCVCANPDCHGEHTVPARWIVRLQVDGFPARTLLVCDDHVIAAWWVSRVSAAVTITAEPLR